MRIGIPKEIKNNENRVAMTPSGVVTLTAAGHEVIVETEAGLKSGFSDLDYSRAGATMTDKVKDVWQVDMVMKVKEPIKEEYDHFHEGLILFTYLHLAAEPELAAALVKNKVISIAYETVQLRDNSLPLLTPMSVVAGRMSTQIGARFLEQTQGGRGVLLGGVPGVSRGKVTVIGGGMAGTNAARIAIGMGAQVTVIDLNMARLVELEELFGNDVQTLVSNEFNIAESVKDSDLVIGAVLIPGAKAPKLVSEEMIKTMKPGAVLVDIAIDQGGIFETSDRITTHDAPIHEKHGVVHYAVANMPGAVPNTSTMALTNVTVPYALQIANKGYEQACLDNEALAKGINTLNGHVTYKAVAEDLGYDYVSPKELMKCQPELQRAE